MTRKENVKKAIHFQNPDYIPLAYYGTDPERMQKSDIFIIAAQDMYGGKDGLTTEWNFSWDESERGSFKLGVVKEPAIQDWPDLDHYVPFDPDVPGRFTEARGIMDEYPGRYYVADFILSGFTIASFIRGFEDFLTDLYIEPENVERLLDIVFETEMKLMKACADNGFDAVFLADDLGTQNSLIISPDLFRQFFLQRYKRQFEYAHSLGLDVFLHSCGYIIDILGDFADIGLDVFNPGQPSLNGVEKLGSEYAGKLCFACPIGYQTTAISGTVKDIENEVIQYVNCLSADKAGLIGLVASEKGLCELEVPEKNREFIPVAFERHCGCRQEKI